MRLYLDAERLHKLARENHATYVRGEPFPHVVLDNVLPDEMLDTVLRDFPSADSNVWREYRNYHEGKLETQGEGNVSDDISLVLYQFNSAPFIRFLQELTGIDGLIPDPYYTGGGLHQIPRGGRLGIHADFARHPHLELHRRLNVLVYLNKNWRDEYGGGLELWTADQQRCVEVIAPVFNRMVVFSITDWAYHGHPKPLSCPTGVTRKSLALYYFTVARPEGEVDPSKESTRFIPLPGEHVPEGTIFDRGASYTGAVERRKGLLHGAIKAIAPPIALGAARRLRERKRRP